jgi:hypothetical protein
MSAGKLDLARIVVRDVVGELRVGVFYLLDGHDDTSLPM